MSILRTSTILPLNDISVGIGAASNEVCAILNVQSNNQGVLLPRLTTSQRNAIAPTTDGLIIYNTDSHALEHYNSLTTSWESSDGVQSLNGLTSKLQFLTNGSAGTTPNWTQSGGSTNQLNIPMASSSGVSAGLLSKNDYDFFNNRVLDAKNIVYVVSNPIALPPNHFNSAIVTPVPPSP